MPPVHDPAELFRHVSAEKAVFYRRIMEVFAAAKRQYRLQLRPDEVLAEVQSPESPPRIEEVNAALTQLAEWGNLQSQPDTARVSNLNNFYRARFLYRLSLGGEAVEAALALFAQTLQRRAELQTVALEDITSRLLALQALIDGQAQGTDLDVPKAHEILRDMVRVFESLADNAQAFMAGVARSIELQQAEAGSVVAYKRRLIDYLDRFMRDLVARSDAISRMLQTLSPGIDALLLLVAEREARDAAPGAGQDVAEEQTRRWQAWRERWKGLCGWFLPAGAGGRRPNCCAPGPAPPFRSCSVPSRRSTSVAAAAATGPPTSACSPAGSPPARTTPTPTGWRGRRSRSTRPGTFR